MKIEFKPMIKLKRIIYYKEQSFVTRWRKNLRTKRLNAKWFKREKGGQLVLYPGGTQRSSIAGRLRPMSHPFLFYVFFSYHFLRKRYPFRLPSIDKRYPFHISSLEVCISFSCCKCVFFKIWINKKPDWERFLDFFTAIMKCICDPFLAFL